MHGEDVPKLSSCLLSPSRDDDDDDHDNDNDDFGPSSSSPPF
jgi:hypothetical protein